MINNNLYCTALLYTIIVNSNLNYLLCLCLFFIENGFVKSAHHGSISNFDLSNYFFTNFSCQQRQEKLQKKRRLRERGSRSGKSEHAAFSFTSTSSLPYEPLSPLVGRLECNLLICRYHKSTKLSLRERSASPIRQAVLLRSRLQLKRGRGFTSVSVRNARVGEPRKGEPTGEGDP